MSGLDRPSLREDRVTLTVSIEPAWKQRIRRWAWKYIGWPFRQLICQAKGHFPVEYYGRPPTPIGFWADDFEARIVRCGRCMVKLGETTLEAIKEG